MVEEGAVRFVAAEENVEFDHGVFSSLSLHVDARGLD